MPLPFLKPKERGQDIVQMTKEQIFAWNAQKITEAAKKLFQRKIVFDEEIAQPVDLIVDHKHVSAFLIFKVENETGYSLIEAGKFMQAICFLEVTLPEPRPEKRYAKRNWIWTQKQILGEYGEYHIFISSGSTTDEKLEGNGLGTALFSLSDLVFEHANPLIPQKYAHLPVYAEIVDESHKTNHEKLTHWAADLAGKFGYTQSTNDPYKYVKRVR